MYTPGPPSPPGATLPLNTRKHNLNLQKSWENSTPGWGPKCITNRVRKECGKHDAQYLKNTVSKTDNPPQASSIVKLSKKMLPFVDRPGDLEIRKEK